jgi:hypothetical protein
LWEAAAASTCQLANAKRQKRKAVLPRSGTSYIDRLTEEHTMPKGEQRSNKMTKKPKKDKGGPAEPSPVSTRPMPPTTAVLPKGKLKNK